MAESRFGYANVNLGRYSAEQNMRNMKSFVDKLSEDVSFYIQKLEDENEELKQEINKLKEGQ